MSSRHEGQRRQAGDCHVPRILIGAEGMIVALVTRQVGQALVDGALRRRGDHALGGAAVGKRLAGLAFEQGCGAGQAQNAGGALRQELSAAWHGTYLCYWYFDGGRCFTYGLRSFRNWSYASLLMSQRNPIVGPYIFTS